MLKKKTNCILNIITTHYFVKIKLFFIILIVASVSQYYEEFPVNILFVGIIELLFFCSRKLSDKILEDVDCVLTIDVEYKSKLHRRGLRFVESTNMYSLKIRDKKEEEDGKFRLIAFDSICVLWLRFPVLFISSSELSLYFLGLDNSSAFCY